MVEAWNFVGRVEDRALEEVGHIDRLSDEREGFSILLDAILGRVTFGTTEYAEFPRAQDQKSPHPPPCAWWYFVLLRERRELRADASSKRKNSNWAWRAAAT
jgi:hypothetical protein